MNIIFFGSSQYCLPVVHALFKNFNLQGVITKSPPNSVYDFCHKNKIKVITPEDVAQLLELKPDVSRLKPDLAVVSDYGLIIPEEIFKLPKYETLNIHFSRLPQFRGPSPVQYSILFGQQESWITITQITSKVDAGPIIAQIKYPFSPQTEDTKSLYTKLFQNLSAVLPGIIKDYLDNKFTLLAQDEKNVSYTGIITRSDGFLPLKLFQLSLTGQSGLADDQNTLLAKSIQKSDNLALGIERAIRAFNPWPGVWTLLSNGKRLKIIKGKLEYQRLTPIVVQLEGKKPVSWKQFLEGYPSLFPASSKAAKSSL